jgi:hypothetical protein
VVQNRIESERERERERESERAKEREWSESSAVKEEGFRVIVIDYDYE